jgi:phosphatidylglycerophosphate synthase
MESTRVSSPPAFRDATRVLSSVLAPLERRVLHYLARRMPRWINSDHLTALALLAMLGAGLSFWLSAWTPIGLVLVVVCLAINWFGDSLDGTLARVRQHQRPRYGYYVDHVVDMVGTLFLLGGLALSGLMHPLLALGLVIGYLLLAAEIYLAAHVLGEFRITYFQLGPTELRIVLAAGSLWAIARPTVVLFGQPFLLFDAGAVVSLVGMAVVFTLTAVRHTRMLYRAEPIPYEGLTGEGS